MSCNVTDCGLGGFFPYGFNGVIRGTAICKLKLKKKQLQKLIFKCFHFLGFYAFIGYQNNIDKNI